ncbi:BREX system P-loop protein BrxC [Lacticaseibacillus saniviri]
MKIKDLFAKPIDRGIQGVIKVGQENNIQQELDEYVVTRELQTQFATFFSAYEKALNGPTDDMGVWISGFFGSGKSHFLKILSYILANKEVDGRHAVDFFEDKITDPMTYNRMIRAAESDTDVILFNIDSKAMSGAKNDSNVIINVFLQVFNEMQNFSTTNPWIADLERDLAANGQYEQFQQKFNELEPNNLTWFEGRNNYAMNMGTIRDALVQTGIRSEADAQGFIDTLMTPYQINIETFGQLVNNFIEQTGKRVAFLVDEVGQFVGDSVQRMLNLQTMVEELGSATHGKAWVIITSQQAIGDVTTNLNGQDFSKIQGRFKTRIAMSSANVDEVIKKRLLAKTPVAQRELEGVYQANSATLNNAIDFDDGVTRQKFGTAADFADNYPFIPYQFNLLQAVLTAVRTHGSDGKHLSEGERSMLSIFQESAVKQMKEEEGTLVPFSLFFEGLSQFLDHTHRIVIEHAHDNHSINPADEKNPFAIQVLKVLFMVKYLENFKATLNNIVTLMIDSINIDRIELTKKVQDALEILRQQGVIEKNLDIYVFLTDAEQDINDGIEHVNINDADVNQAMQNIFFDNKVIGDKYIYPKLHNRYSFTFNRMLDETLHGKNNGGLTIRVITPINDIYGDESSYAQLSIAPEVLVIVLPDERGYIDLLSRSAKIRQYVLSNTNNQDPRFKLLLDTRSSERQDLNETARTQALNALEDAKIYVSGHLLEGTRDFTARLQSAEQTWIDNNYRDLQYIEAAKSNRDITQLLGDDGMIKTEENKQAAEAIFGWIQKELQRTQHVTLKALITRFSSIPYGYIDEDTEWLVASLFKNNRIKLTYNGEVISMLHATAAQVTEYLTKRQYTEKIAIQVQKVTTERELKRLREIAGEVFNKKTFSADDAETVARETINKASSDLENLKLFEQMNQSYPGHNLLQAGIQLLTPLVGSKDTDEFIANVLQRYDDLLEWSEDYEDTGTREFYLSDSQQKIWDDGLNDIQIYEKSKDLFSSPELSSVVDELQVILKANRAVGSAVKVKELDTRFDELFNQVFNKEEQRVFAEIDQIKARGEDNLTAVTIADEDRLEQRKTFAQRLEEIRQEAGQAHALDDLTITVNKAQSQLDQLISRLNALAEEYQTTSQVDPVAVDDTTTTSTIKENGRENTADERKPVAVVNVKMRDLMDANVSIKSESDIDALVSALRKELSEQLDKAQIINVQL